MQVGAVLRKIKSRTWKKQRYFKLQDDGMTIWYKSKKAGNTHSTCENKLISKYSSSSKRFPNWCHDFLLLSFTLSFGERCGDNTWGPPVWGSAQHCRRVPGRAVLHAGLPWSQKQLGPGGRVSGGSTVLDQRHEEADWEPGKHGRARATGPVSICSSNLYVSCNKSSKSYWFNLAPSVKKRSLQ